MSNGWDDIPRSDDPDVDSVKRADPRHPFPFYRGRDFNGRYLFTLEGPAKRERLGKPLPLAGIEISITEIRLGTCRILITLADAAELDVFEALCSNLMSATLEIPKDDTEGAILAVIARLNRWHELLKKRRDAVLTRQEIVGLFGELIFLRDVAMEHLSLPEAVNAWRGSYGDEQDFVFGSTIVEVKTQTVTADRKVQISSADQLDTTSGPIILACQLLASAEATDVRARTLNVLVTELEERLKVQDPKALDLFRAALIEGRYARRAEYDEEAWICTERAFLDVIDEFPRIVARDLNDGIENVRYMIRYSAVVRFQISAVNTMERLFGHRD